MSGTDINELFEALRRHGEEEYKRGVAEGRLMERGLLWAYLAETPDLAIPAAPTPVAPSADSSATPSAQGSENEDRRKAPKGLIQTITKRVLTERPGLRLPALENAVLQADTRIARKSVYNHMNANRETLYRYVNGEWYLRERAEPGQAWLSPSEDAA